MLVTYRDTELVEGHRLHGWLADTSRMPSVSRLRLERLGHADTEELVARLAGTGGTGGLADIVTRSGGNPYYAQLLLAGAAGTERSPDGDLRSALLGSWHGLRTEARKLLQLLSVGGRPVAIEVLEHLIATRGGDPREVRRSLSEAVSVGLVTLTHSPGGEAWFHHPLIAEVVAGTLAPHELQRVHQEYVKVLEVATGLPDASRAAQLALHHHGAGNLDDAFIWSLRAADAAAQVRGYAEVWDHLHRACRLWDLVGDTARAAAGDRIDLWQRASEAAWSAGEHALAIRLREEAIAALDGEADPVRYLRLRLTLTHRQAFYDLNAIGDVAAARIVVDFAEEYCPGTSEHAQALARLAFAEQWNDEQPAALRHATTAVRIARRIGSSEALTWALAVRSQARVDAPTGLADALQAVALAREVGDPELLGVTAIMGSNTLVRLGQEAEAADLRLRTFRQLLGTGSVHDAMWPRPETAVPLLIDLGRWDEARGVLREMLGRRHTPEQGAAVRGAAALLAFRTGDVDAGLTHLARARELVPGPWHIGQMLDFVEMEGLWASGKLREALACATGQVADWVPIDAGGADETMAAAARIAADLGEATASRSEAMAVLERLELLRGTEPFAQSGPDDLYHPALGRLYEADRGRCHGGPDTSPLWRSAVAACADAGLVWEEARGSYHLARSLLTARRSRSEAASALRRAARIADDLGAAPILHEVEELSRQAHILLADPAPAQRASGVPDKTLSALTGREREVLSHVVAGRTYAEIAHELFISEKTVSVHVSNLLRKTGTASRIELADLARRSSAT